MIEFVACKTCGKPVQQRQRRAGRLARFCSAECRHTAKLRYQANWRAKNPGCQDGGWSKVRKAAGALDRLGLTRRFYSGAGTLSADHAGGGTAESPQTLDFWPETVTQTRIISR